MTRTVLRVAVSALAAVACFTIGPAAAGVPTDQLKGQINRVLKTLADPDLKKENRAKDRRQAVRRIAEDIFDFSETAKRSLGTHWNQRTPAEREEFVRLFSDLLERSYISKIELYNGEKIQYAGDTVDGELAVVHTKIITAQNSEIPVDYQMYRKGDRWLVYDVKIEGVSMVSNYRTQFNKIIRTSSYQELVKKMKTNQDEFRERERQQTRS
ncbi:MAG: ABC transporter substrate-binding protein [Candidatus Rokubacteria bacterium]|nr:ABC transporter substrate-binding protein [Candidatus Rokubacteria bacterium]MBI3826634.1 ABC transporter substrate-binding protein [Candidatus Rokubacteria bacterium]